MLFSLESVVALHIGSSLKHSSSGSLAPRKVCAPAGKYPAGGVTITSQQVSSVVPNVPVALHSNDASPVVVLTTPPVQVPVTAVPVESGIENVAVNVPGTF